jgi:hypothetical protein
LPGLFARLGLCERIRLTPEGASFAELKRLTDTLIWAGTHFFVFSYHSPSVVPGNTPYVQNEAQLQGFLRVIEEYCEYFFGVCGGAPGTPQQLHATCTALVPRSGHRHGSLGDEVRSTEVA